MKKNLLSIFALVLAISFSAFTVESHHNSPKAKKTADLFWYRFDGTFITSLVGSGATDKANAEDIADCHDNPSAALCAYGYENAQTGLPKLPPSSDDHFKKTN